MATKRQQSKRIRSQRRALTDLYHSAAPDRIDFEEARRIATWALETPLRAGPRRILARAYLALLRERDAALVRDEEAKRAR